MLHPDAAHSPPVTRHATTRRLGASLGATLLCLTLLSACSDDSSSDGGAASGSTSSSPDFCGTYEDLSTAAKELAAKDPATADVEELQAAADDVQTELDQFQAVAEGRLDDALTRLRANVDDVRQAAQDAGAQAREAAQPVIEDALTKVKAAWAVVQDVAEVRCPPEG